MSVCAKPGGLFGVGLVEKRQLPRRGAVVGARLFDDDPADPSFTAQMLCDFIAAGVVARGRCGPGGFGAKSARWARHCTGDHVGAGSPSHALPAASHATAFSIAGHLGKVRLFMNAMGFTSVPHESDPMALNDATCPFTERCPR